MEPALDEVSADEPAPLRRGSKLYLVASAIAQISALLRYVALARLLGPEQLGLSATLVVTAAFFDLISDTGSDRFLIQDDAGNDPEVQKLVQLVYVGRGLLIASCLVVFAIPIAAFYKAPRLAGGLACLALSPLILGFLHLDLRRAQRRLDFRSEAFSLIAGETVGVCATVAAAWLTRDFTAILYGLIARALMMVLVSHLRAERPYRLGWSKLHARRLSRFAAPLMLSGLMLFIGSQGDRVVVANQLGIKALGQYSAVLLLIYYPSAMILRYMHAIYMPMIAAARRDPHEFTRVNQLLGSQTLLLAVAMAVGFAIVAPPAVVVLYGARYREAGLVVALIGVLQTTRFLINWPTTVALSLGRSRTVLLSNMVRLLAFPGAIAGLWLVGGLEGVVGGFAVGEGISIAVSLILVNRDAGQPAWQGFDRLALFVLMSAGVLVWSQSSHAPLAVRGVMLAATAAFAALLFRRERSAMAEGFAIFRGRFASLARLLA
jgi:O-antigen/teichoic acid export membrane protein